ncbi:MAG: SEC-C domain-containing protein [Candidatus Schekmanbacteria bacterium]|nr:SEC-C domain-containing protein [Candidatus Schekmanbacteria bacterium]
MDNNHCLCGSGKPYETCCKIYFNLLNLKHGPIKDETIFFEWINKYSNPIVEAFIDKTHVYIYRISLYLDLVFNRYFNLGFEESPLKDMNNPVTAIKLHILHTLLGSFSCLSQGLYFQSGILLRSVMEDCFVLIDIFERKNQYQCFIQNKYSTNGLISRVKNVMPDFIIRWYGHFSANFAHVGPLHPISYLPRACYPDNYIIFSGLHHLVVVIVGIHLTFERVHFDQIDEPFLWETTEENKLSLNENSKIFDLTNTLLDELCSEFSPDERKTGFIYSEKCYRPK